MEKALVMLSGGLDSATCLYWAKEQYDVSAITFNYFGRLENEKHSTARLASAAAVRVIEIDMPFVRESADAGDGFADADLKRAAYVPARNMMFYSIAAHHAEFLGARWIVGGHNMHDASFFKDASRQYIEKMNELFIEACLSCGGQPYQIVLPLAEMDRTAIVKLAQKLNVPIELTWSCHAEGDRHCGRCYSCRQRLEAFATLGISDPAFSR
jgi:7-cyano-7-deazaguanine synthase